MPPRIILPEKILCPLCAFPNPAVNGLVEVDYCERCGAPMGTVYTMDPQGSMGVAGWAFREEANRPPGPVVLAGIWVLVLPGLMCLPMICLGRMDSDGHLGGFVAYFVAAVVLLGSATKSFLRGRKAQPKSSG